jgi:hypothetical protein
MRAWFEWQRTHDEIGAQEPCRLSVHLGLPTAVELLDKDGETALACGADSDQPVIAVGFQAAWTGSTRWRGKRR